MRANENFITFSNSKAVIDKLLPITKGRIKNKKRRHINNT